MTQMKPKPEGVEIPEDRTWEDLAPATRFYYRNREEERQRIDKRKKKIRKWYQTYKAERGCNRCDEEDPRCLDFHHVADKEVHIGQMVSDGYSKERILKEIENCIILCANCHRKEHINKVI